VRPRERREIGERDLFRSWLDQIIDLNHALVKLARAIDWRFLEERFGAAYTDGPGKSAAADAADGWWPSSSTCLTSPTMCCAIDGSRTRNFNSSAARSSSSTGGCSIAPH